MEHGQLLCAVHQCTLWNVSATSCCPPVHTVERVSSKACRQERKRTSVQAEPSVQTSVTSRHSVCFGRFWQIFPVSIGIEVLDNLTRYRFLFCFDFCCYVLHFSRLFGCDLWNFLFDNFLIWVPYLGMPRITGKSIFYRCAHEKYCCLRICAVAFVSFRVTL